MPSPTQALRRIAPGSTTLGASILAQRQALNRRYLVELRGERLLQNHYVEAGISVPVGRSDELHWGWESPSSLVRGHFLGHWLSAAAHQARATDDAELRGRAEWAVAELARCQRSNGGEWLSPLPQSYLERAARGEPTWAVQYVVEKTLSGLLDAHLLLGSEQALDVLERMAGWMHRWTGRFSAHQMDDLVDLECGHMMGLWAGLYGVTGKAQHRELMERYYRHRLFDTLLAGRDVLSNRHANTTIPEACGVARAYEVTGEETYRRAVEAFWRCAMEEREQFCTGAQSAGEFWVPPGRLPIRLGATTQEHCVVYNLRRLAEHLLRWHGDARYADSRERLLWNGILAQQNPGTGMVCYYLPMRAGSNKSWGSRTDDFFCCHGTLVQAHALHGLETWYESDESLLLAEWVPSRLHWSAAGGAEVTIEVEALTQTGQLPSGRVDLDRDVGVGRPACDEWRVTVSCAQPRDLNLQLRIPWWAGEGAVVRVDDGSAETAVQASTFHRVSLRGQRSSISVRLPRRLVAEKLPGSRGTYAFLDGPEVLAGLCDEERVLHGDPDRPGNLLAPDDEREWDRWNVRYRTVGQRCGLRLVPLHEVTDERYTLYFPVQPVSRSSGGC